MKNKTAPKLTGIALAIAAAGLVSGCASSGGSSSSPAAANNTSSADLVHCYGVNKCNGHNDCKTANNACAGHAACKGEGFVTLSAKACSNIGGTQKDSWSKAGNQADLVHCYGINKCGGHNDCKTAENACGGHASCKGKGFVSIPAKACSDTGGKAG